MTRTEPMKRQLSLILFFFLSLDFSLSFTACSKLDPKPDETAIGEAPRPKVSASAATEFKAATFASQILMRVTKDEKIPVAATFNVKAGELKWLDKPSGAAGLRSAEASVVMDVASFNSGLLLRDERVREIFFGADNGVSAEVSFAVKAATPEDLVPLRTQGAVTGVAVTGDLKAFGKSLPIAATIDLSVTPEGRLRAVSTSPIVIKISELGLNTNLAKLMAECGHKSVSDEVQVEFALEFEGVK